MEHHGDGIKRPTPPNSAEEQLDPKEEVEKVPEDTTAPPPVEGGETGSASSEEVSPRNPSYFKPGEYEVPLKPADQVQPKTEPLETLAKYKILGCKRMITLQEAFTNTTPIEPNYIQAGKYDVPVRSEDGKELLTTLENYKSLVSDYEEVFALSTPSEETSPRDTSYFDPGDNEVSNISTEGRIMTDYKTLGAKPKATQIVASTSADIPTTAPPTTLESSVAASVSAAIANAFASNPRGKEDLQRIFHQMSLTREVDVDYSLPGVPSTSTGLPKMRKSIGTATSDAPGKGFTMDDDEKLEYIRYRAQMQLAIERSLESFAQEQKELDEGDLSDYE